MRLKINKLRYLKQNEISMIHETTLFFVPEINSFGILEYMNTHHIKLYPLFIRFTELMKIIHKYIKIDFSFQTISIPSLPKPGACLEENQDGGESRTFNFNISDTLTDSGPQGSFECLQSSKCG